MRVSKPKRGQKPAKRMDLTFLRDALRDGRIWVQLAVVQSHGTGSHWERAPDGDIMVDVVTAPRGLELVCRLGSAAGQVAAGLWRVPAQGTEVLVAIPDGELDHHPSIIQCLSSGGAPVRVSDDKTLLASPDAVEIDAPAIRVGGEHADQGAVRGTEYRASENSFVNALQTWQAAVSAAIAGDPSVPGGLKPPVAGATTALATAIASFTSSGFLSTVVKVR